ncbi:MAG: cobalamin biosynthesis protein CbiD [Desulfamplus sp.]|nr:cobalamin biosynthesis protein CbiD [Desulfamplus sp.]
MGSSSLKRGFTTGAAAAAAAKAAVIYLLKQSNVSSMDEQCGLEGVSIRCLNNEWITIPIQTTKLLSPSSAEAIVIKDAGDDPDVTHRAEIGARVTLLAQAGSLDNVSISRVKRKNIVIKGGHGVGMVTKPGLEIPPGEPAINPGPREMIKEAVEQVFNHSASPGEPLHIIVEIFVPQGEKLAGKTLNARLGIIGGISILGTTGIVHPMSHDAYIATIRSGISVARAAGVESLIFTTGRRSERFAMAIFPESRQEAFIQIGDFFRASLEEAASLEQGASAHAGNSDSRINLHGWSSITPDHGNKVSVDHGKNVSVSTVKNITITVFFGKAVKMAMGFPHTHAAKSELTLKTLAQWAQDITGNLELSRSIATSNTARQAFAGIYPSFMGVVELVGDKIISSARLFCQNRLNIRAVILDFEGDVVYDKCKVR